MTMKEQQEQDVANGCKCSRSLVTNLATGDEVYNVWPEPDCPVHGIGTPTWEAAK